MNDADYGSSRESLRQLGQCRRRRNCLRWGAIDAHSPRTRANGQVTVATETLSDGDHVMHIVPNPTATASVGPAVAEGLAAATTRMFRSLDVTVTVTKGKITATSAPPLAHR